MTTILTESNVHRLIDSLTGRDRLIVRLLASTGLRVSELIALDAEHIDADGTIRLPSFKGKGNGKYDQRHQEAYIDAALRDDLLTHCQNGPLFRNARGERMSRHGVNWLLREAGERVGLHVHPHAFRHRYVTRLMENETPLHTVQALARHRSPTTTMRYAHATQASKRAAAMGVGV